ncbi:MAG: hypothetical protein M3Z41_10335 [Candidatus Eremiobacteraeota bacterium]|nr:hypothetical protein [Candidatus Eremiobacteraeota bacterium]
MFTRCVRFGALALTLAAALRTIVLADSVPSAVPAPAAAVSAAPAPSPARRALPAPADPIFPASDFIGPTIGVPTDRGNRLYGWFDLGLLFATSKHSSY